MANKRDLKRVIHYTCSDLIIISADHALKGNRAEMSDDLRETIASILRLHHDFITRVSHPEPGMKVKNYYQALVKDFAEKVEEFLETITSED